MATFRILPSGNINVMIRRRGHRAITKTFKSQPEAELWASQMEGSETSPDAYTLAYYGQLYLDTLKGRGGTEASRYRLANLIRGLPSELSMVTAIDLDRYVANRLRTVVGSTVRLELQLLSRILKMARLPNLLAEYQLPKAGKARELILSPIQYQMILNDIAPKVRPLVVLSWETAMRRSECFTITPSCIDWQRKTLRLVDTKNGHSRDVPLNSRALDVLLKASQLTTGERLFTSRPCTVSQAFRRSCDRLRLPKELCFHSLRHSAITRYANMGFSTLQLQVISGHRDIGMLFKYTHLKAKDIVHLMENCDK